MLSAEEETRTPNRLILTTTTFVAISVCGLDFLLTLDCSLGSPCKVSTHDFTLARD